LKIIFIITGLSDGGAEKMLFSLLQHIDVDRYKPSVVSLSTKGKYGKYIEQLGIPCLELKMSHRSINLWKLLLLIRHIRHIKPDVVHTWMYHANLLGGVASKLSGVNRIIWSIRQSNLNYELNGKKTLFVIKMGAWLSSFIPRTILYNSKHSQDVHNQFGYAKRKNLYIPNGFDLFKFKFSSSNRSVVRNSFGISDKVPVIGLIARFDIQKNHQGFFMAAEMIYRVMPDVNFILVGSEIDYNNKLLMKWINKNNLEESVHLLGMRDDVHRLMSAMDVLVLSSYGESFPNVLGEAMSCGIPCVVTNVGDCAEIVSDTGRVVEAGDMEHLAQSVLKLLQLPELELKKLGRLARNRIKNFYDINSVVDVFENLYDLEIRDVK